MAMAVTGTEDTVEATMVATEDTTTARGWFFYSTTYELLYYELLYEMKHQFLRIDNSLYPYFLLLNGNSTGPLMLRLRLMLSPPPPLSPDMVTTAMDMDTALTGKD